MKMVLKLIFDANLWHTADMLHRWPWMQQPFMTHDSCGTKSFCLDEKKKKLHPGLGVKVFN